MIIYGTMAVKNEADILADSIESSLRWVDKIFVIDNGSKDSTLEILKNFGEQVVLLASFHNEFQEGIKSIPFN